MASGFDTSSGPTGAVGALASGSSEALAPADHKTLSRTVADWLALRIVNGQVAPGERLTESALAELAGVSRSPVREALRMLAADGLIEIVPRFGAQVAQLSADDARELYACRMLLEPRCARDAVASMTPAGAAELNRIRGAMEAAAAASDGRRFLDENVAYFRTLISFCPNALLRELVELTWRRALRYWSIFARLPYYGAGSIEQHRLLHEAVRAGDPAAAEAADRAILDRALGELLSTLEPTR